MSPWGHTLTRHNSFYYALSNSFPFLFSHGLKDATKLIKSSFVFNPDYFSCFGFTAAENTMVFDHLIQALVNFWIVFDFPTAIYIVTRQVVPFGFLWQACLPVASVKLPWPLLLLLFLFLLSFLMTGVPPLPSAREHFSNIFLFLRLFCLSEFSQH